MRIECDPGREEQLGTGCEDEWRWGEIEGWPGCAVTTNVRSMGVEQLLKGEDMIGGEVKESLGLAVGRSSAWIFKIGSCF